MKSTFQKLYFRFMGWLHGWDIVPPRPGKIVLRDSRMWICTNCMDRKAPYTCPKCDSHF